MSAEQLMIELGEDCIVNLNSIEAVWRRGDNITIFLKYKNGLTLNFDNEDHAKQMTVYLKNYLNIVEREKQVD